MTARVSPDDYGTELIRPDGLALGRDAAVLERLVQRPFGTAGEREVDLARRRRGSRSRCRRRGLDRATGDRGRGAARLQLQAAGPDALAGPGEDRRQLRRLALEPYDEVAAARGGRAGHGGDEADPLGQSHRRPGCRVVVLTPFEVDRDFGARRNHTVEAVAVVGHPRGPAMPQSDVLAAARRGDLLAVTELDEGERADPNDALTSAASVPSGSVTTRVAVIPLVRMSFDSTVEQPVRTRTTTRAAIRFTASEANTAEG